MKRATLLLSLMAFSSLANADNFPQPDVVIDSDTRVRINSKNHRLLHDSIGILKISDAEGTAYCTGTVISQHHVVTAAHCLVSKKKFADKVVFMPGLNGPVSSAKRPFGTFQAIKLQVFKAYFETSSVENDLGLLTFAENLPVSPLAIAAAPSSAAIIGEEVKLTIAGYPGDKTLGTLWEGKGARFGTILWQQSSAHSVDTASGQSGSAVRSRVNGVESVVGIHSSGVDADIFKYNEARFFTAETVQTLKEWMAK